MKTIDMENVNGVYQPALTTREAWRRRIAKTRPIVRVHIEELDDPTDVEQPEGWVLMQAMSGDQKEEWQFRRLSEENYEPDEDRRKMLDRQKTWGEVLKGNKRSLVAHSVVDEQGRLIWSEFDVAELAEVNASALERLYAKAVQLNGLPRQGIPDYLQTWLEGDETHAAPPSEPLGDRIKNSNPGPINGSSSN